MSWSHNHTNEIMRSPVYKRTGAIKQRRLQLNSPDAIVGIWFPGENGGTPLFIRTAAWPHPIVPRSRKRK